MFEPKYIITPLILSRIAEIAEIKAAVERSRVLPLNEAHLRRQAILRMAYTSTSIEGNQLAEFEVGKIYEGKTVRAPQKDVIEVENYYKAISLVEELAKQTHDLTLEEILKVQGTVIDGLMEKAKTGHFRPADVYVLDDLGNGKEVLRFKAPPAEKVPGLLNDLLDWVKEARKNGTHPIIIAGIFHLEFVSIHPFADGNGRSTRLLTQLLLYRLGWDFRKIIVLEDYYNRDRLAYYNAEHMEENKEYVQGREFTHWLEYFTTGFLVESRKALEQIQQIGFGKASKKNEQIFLDHAEIQIMDFLTTTGRITSDDVSEILRLTKRSAQLKIKRLLDKKLLKSKGSGPTTFYILNK